MESWHGPCEMRSILICVNLEINLNIRCEFGKIKFNKNIDISGLFISSAYFEIDETINYAE